MLFSQPRAFLSWAKEYIAQQKKHIPQNFSGDQYDRRRDYDYCQKFWSLTKNFAHTYPFHKITNEPSEKRKFFRAFYQDKRYNPAFHYQKRATLNPLKATKIILALGKFAQTLPSATIEGQACRRRIFDAQKAILLISLSQKEGFSWASRAYYNIPKALRAPLPAKTKFPHNAQEYIEPYEIVYLTQKVLKKIGLKQKARLSLEEHRFSGLATTSLKVKIGAGTFRSPARMIRSLAHEILGHALCATNAKAYPVYFARRNSIPALYKEEGLAVKLGELTYQKLKGGLPRPLRSRREDFLPHLRVKATQIATHHSFSDTFVALVRRNINKDLAWELTTRVKRGLPQTALPGANYHDCLYYLGLQQINAFLKDQKLKSDQVLYWLNKLIQGKFDLAEFASLQKHYPDQEHLNLQHAFTIFIAECQKTIKKHSTRI